MKNRHHFIFKKPGKKLVSQNFGALSQVEMALNSLFMPSFMLFTFVCCLPKILRQQPIASEMRQKQRPENIRQGTPPW